MPYKIGDLVHLKTGSVQWVVSEELEEGMYETSYWSWKEEATFSEDYHEDCLIICTGYSCEWCNFVLPETHTENLMMPCVGAMEFMSELLAYPTNLDAAVGLVLKKFKGEAIDTPTLVRAGWHVVGYALGQAFPEGKLPLMCDPPATLTHEELVSHLEVLHGGGLTTEGFTFPWQEVAATLLPYLLKWLQSK